MLEIRTRLRYDGPLFDFRGRRIFQQYAEELEKEGAEWALDHVRSTFHRSFKQPTGYYESRVETHRAATGWEVWDHGEAGPVYGPWLEGVGSRNQTTRFKGYHAFRKAANALERRFESMADRIFALRYRNRL